MKIQKTIAALLAVTALDTIAVQAQTDEVFRVQINVTCRPGVGNKNNKMTNRDFIQQCVGTGFTKKEINQNFQLVFNPVADSMQVVNTTDGSVVCDVFEFQPGTNVVGNSTLERLLFVFVPGKSDAVGTAVITEKVRGNKSRARINGKIQFAMSESSSTTTTNEVSVSRSVSVTLSNNSSGNVVTSDVSGNFIESVPILATASEVQVCNGTFTVGKAFVAGQNVQSTQLTNRQRRQLQQQQQNQAIATTTTTTNTNITGTITNITGTLSNVVGSVTNLSNFGTAASFGNATMLNAIGF